MSRRFRIPARFTRDPRTLVRAGLGVLLLANIVAALFLFKPWGGSPEDLARELTSLQQQLLQRQAQLKRSKTLLLKVEAARTQGDGFLATYFAERRSAYPLLVGELTRLALQVGFKAKEHSFAGEPIEGSDTLEMVTVIGNYEGTYSDLVQFINALDRSPRFFLVEQLQASPQQGTPMLNVNLRMHAFVRDDGSPPLPAMEAPPASETAPKEVASR
ncbi:MAG: hypothetical protein SFV54_26270 [Bryobacteraceae bacterium]|nr:hypothetical protein [Bryobacteraceae bacterium]